MVIVQPAFRIGMRIPFYSLPHENHFSRIHYQCDRAQFLSLFRTTGVCVYWSLQCGQVIIAQFDFWEKGPRESVEHSRAHTAD